MSKVTRAGGQDVLFDYLHCTRNLNFTDVEHISKDSPYFLMEMLSEIGIEQDVRWYLSTFLCYNPINEFEPLFKSLALTPLEFTYLIPRNSHILFKSFFAMIENFHVLCDYEIPRGNIGKMYKKAKGIFGYDYVVLSLNLKAYEKLGLSTSTTIKLVSCSPLLLIGDINVLGKLKGLGIENDWIRCYLSGESTCNWNRMLGTIGLLDKVGYTEEHMGILFKTNPTLLLEGSGKKIYILIAWLLKLGLKIDVVFLLFSRNPHIISGKCLYNLWHAVDFLFDIGMELKDIANFVSTHIQLLSSYSLKGPKTVLRSLKVGRDSLCQVIKDDPLKLLSFASKKKRNRIVRVTHPNPGKYMKKLAFLMKLGYVENSDEMTKALKQFRGRADQLQERFDCLVKAGLDRNNVSHMIRKVPSMLNQTKEVIEKKIDCLKNCLGYHLESVVAFPAYLCYDIKRIKLRFSMYVWLTERGAAKPMLSLSTILASSDARFVKYFVDVHPEGPAMWEGLKESSRSS